MGDLGKKVLSRNLMGNERKKSQTKIQNQTIRKKTKPPRGVKVKWVITVL